MTMNGFLKLALTGITIGWLIGVILTLLTPTPTYYQNTTVNVPRVEPVACASPVAEIYSVSAYNVGDVSQTDDTPCLGAWGDNLCDLLTAGTQICANNHYPWGTKLYVEGYGTCVVMDRMNSRYSKYYIDIAFPVDQKQQALKWGRRDKLVNKQ